MLMPSPIRCWIAGRPGARRRHLDHQILAVDFLPEPLGFGDRALGVHREIGRHFQADETVMPCELIVDRAQHVGGVLDVLDREMLEQFGHRPVALFQRLADRRVIFVRTADRLLEDRRVRRDALDAVAVDQLFQVALGDETAGEEIQPDRLAVAFECFDGIHDACFCPGWSMFRRLGQFGGSRCLFVAGADLGDDPGEYAYPQSITPYATYRSRKGNWLFGGSLNAILID